MYQKTHRAICTAVEVGVARPMWKMRTGVMRLIRKDTGTRTPKAPTMPWAMTKAVSPQPEK